MFWWFFGSAQCLPSDWVRILHRTRWIRGWRALLLVLNHARSCTQAHGHHLGHFNNCNILQQICVFLNEWMIIRIIVWIIPQLTIYQSPFHFDPVDTTSHFGAHLSSLKYVGRWGYNLSDSCRNDWDQDRHSSSSGSRIYINMKES